MSIRNEKKFIDISRLIKRKGISAEEVPAFYESFKGLPDAPGITDEEKAEDIAYKVLLIFDESKELDPDDVMPMIANSRKALEICPSCVVVHEACFKTSEHLPERDRHILNGVEVGERKFGGEYEEANAGNFWKNVTPRSFIRLLSSKAQILAKKGEKEEALEIYERLLTMDPGDGVNCRWYAQILWLEYGEYDKYIDHIIDWFGKEVTPHHFYNYALYRYLTEGESSEADTAMREAIKINRFVLSYLKAERKLTADPPIYFDPGEESGAVAYARDALYLWRQQFGIQKWLKKFSASHS